MTIKDILKFIVACIIVAALVGIGYVAYRYYQTPHSLDLGSVGSMAALAQLPPTQCQVATGSFDSSYQGVVYIYEGELRADIIYAGGGTSTTPTLIHTLVATSGEAYRWDEGATQGIEVPFNFSANALSMTCSPWLKPDPTLFQMPLGVSFVQQSAS